MIEFYLWSASVADPEIHPAPAFAGRHSGNPERRRLKRFYVMIARGMP
jgi:hypothetical protein